ncbi:MAG: FIST N-terminal domain-containing protein [Myxococcota bacterium]
MKWASSISTQTSLETAAIETIGAVQTQLREADADLVMVFVSPGYDDAIARLPRLLRNAFPKARIVGCTGGGIAGDRQEIEEGVALSLIAAVLPDVAVKPFHLTDDALPGADADPTTWRAPFGLEPEHQPAFILLPDPFSFNVAQLLDGLDKAYPNAPKVGGMASGGERPGQNALILDDRLYRAGMVGFAIYGDIQVGTIVAQGCRPIGAPMTITRARRNFIFEMDEQEVIPILEDMFETLTPKEKVLFQRSPMMGVAMNPNKDDLRPGDFLIRNIHGVSRQTGGLAINALAQVGQVVQFHIRDAETSAIELQELLERFRRQPGFEPPAGAVMFSCLGRGARFYGEPHHDTLAVIDKLGHVPMSGFFCNGEIGPVHGQTFLHGYTSAFALFTPRGWS